jgi:hypothetical protein
MAVLVAADEYKCFKFDDDKNERTTPGIADAPNLASQRGHCP